MKILVLALILLSSTSSFAINKDALRVTMAMTSFFDITGITELERLIQSDPIKEPSFKIKVDGKGWGFKCQVFLVEQDSAGIYSAKLIDQSNNQEVCNDYK